MRDTEEMAYNLAESKKKSVKGPPVIVEFDEANAEVHFMGLAQTTPPATNVNGNANNTSAAQAGKVRSGAISPKALKDDGSCECASTVAKKKMSPAELKKLNAKQTKLVKDATEATNTAKVTREEAVKAIQKASETKTQSETTSKEVVEKAKVAAATAAKAEAEAISRQHIASVKITSTHGSVAKSERVRQVTKSWTAITVHKHQVWKTYKNIKKNYF